MQILQRKTLHRGPEHKDPDRLKPDRGSRRCQADQASCFLFVFMLYMHISALFILLYVQISVVEMLQHNMMSVKLYIHRHLENGCGAHTKTCRNHSHTVLQYMYMYVICFLSQGQVGLHAYVTESRNNIETQNKMYLIFKLLNYNNANKTIKSIINVRYMRIIVKKKNCEMWCSYKHKCVLIILLCSKVNNKIIRFKWNG